MFVRKCKVCGRALGNKTVKCTYCGALAAKRKSSLMWIVVIIIGAYLVVQNLDNIKTLILDDPAAQVINDVDIDIVWDSGNSDKIMMADIIISNNSQETIQDMKILCTHYDNNGSRVSGKSLTVYESISANDQKTISHFNMGFSDPRIHQTECEITALELM